jgi:hypothetical protein
MGNAHATARAGRRLIKIEKTARDLRDRGAGRAAPAAKMEFSTVRL